MRARGKKASMEHGWFFFFWPRPCRRPSRGYYIPLWRRQPPRSGVIVFSARFIDRQWDSTTTIATGTDRDVSPLEKRRRRATTIRTHAHAFCTGARAPSLSTYLIVIGIRGAASYISWCFLFFLDQRPLCFHCQLDSLPSLYNVTFI